MSMKIHGWKRENILINQLKCVKHVLDYVLHLSILDISTTNQIIALSTRDKNKTYSLWIVR